MFPIYIWKDTFEDNIDKASLRILHDFRIEFPKPTQRRHGEIDWPAEFYLNFEQFDRVINVTFVRLKKHHPSYPVNENDIYIIDPDNTDQPIKYEFKGRTVIGILSSKYLFKISCFWD